MAEDPDRETLARLLTAWQFAFGNIPTMVREAVNKSSYHDYTELHEVLHDIADERGEINRRRLGWWIKRHAGRIVDGLRFVRASGGNRSAEAWKVESVLSVSPVSTQTIQKTVADTSSDCNAYARASRGE